MRFLQNKAVLWVGIIGLVIVSCCFLFAIIAAFGENKPNTCANSVVSSWATNQRQVAGLMDESHNVLGSGDLAGGYRLVLLAKKSHDNIQPPACDTDITLVHSHISNAIDNELLAYEAIANENFRQAEILMMQSDDYMTKANQVMQTLIFKYQE